MATHVFENRGNGSTISVNVPASGDLSVVMARVKFIGRSRNLTYSGMDYSEDTQTGDTIWDVPIPSIPSGTPSKELKTYWAEASADVGGDAFAYADVRVEFPDHFNGKASAAAGTDVSGPYTYLSVSVSAYDLGVGNSDVHADELDKIDNGVDPYNLGDYSVTSLSVDTGYDYFQHTDNPFIQLQTSNIAHHTSHLINVEHSPWYDITDYMQVGDNTYTVGVSNSSRTDVVVEYEMGIPVLESRLHVWNGTAWVKRSKDEFKIQTAGGKQSPHGGKVWTAQGWLDIWG